MTPDKFSSLLGYKSAMVQVRRMLDSGIISASDYCDIETRMCELFGINCGSLLREIEWINNKCNGNIPPTKEAT